MLTVPDWVMRRMEELPESETKTFPASSTVMPRGLLKRASAPVPSLVPETPTKPASVLTAPPGEIFLTVWLSVSVT